MSAAERDPPGCPDLALCTAVITPLRISLAVFINSNLSMMSSQKLFSKYCFIICLEFFDSCICQRMFGHLFDYCIWNRCDISSCQCTVCHMHWVTDAGRDDLCLDACNLENLGISAIRSVPLTEMSSRRPR